LLIGISVNQLKFLPEGTTALGLPVDTGAYLYTLIFVCILKSCHSLIWLACVIYVKSDYLVCNNLNSTMCHNYFEWWHCWNLSRWLL